LRTRDRGAMGFRVTIATSRHSEVYQRFRDDCTADLSGTTKDNYGEILLHKMGPLLT
jgi:hypothetical protein